jgi:glycosyltransferase involved in cell wall biosynthesis
MKVLVTLDFPPETGGMQRYLHAVASHKFTYGDLVLVGCNKKRPTVTVGSGVTVEYIHWWMSAINKKCSLVPLLLRILRLRKTSGESLVIECGNVYASIAPLLASAIIPLRYRTYVYGTEIANINNPGLKNILLRSVLVRAQGLIAISNYTASIVAAMRIKTPITLEYPKIELPERRPPSRLSEESRTNAATGALRLLCVGRLVEHKGHRILLKAVSLLPGDIQWKLVIAGNGPMRAELKKNIAQMNVGNRIEIKSKLSDKDIQDEYSRASIFVFPSTSQGGVEGFGIVLLEAMAAGVPIIASNTGGIPEVLDNGRCGLLVTPQDAPALASAIAEVAGNPDAAQTLATTAWERLVQHYAW